MNDYKAFELVSNTRDGDYPDGNVFKALTDLEDRYKTSKSAVVEELEENGKKKDFEEGRKARQAIKHPSNATETTRNQRGRKIR